MQSGDGAAGGLPQSVIVRNPSTLSVGGSVQTISQYQHSVSGIQSSLAAIPAGSQIYSATLNLCTAPALDPVGATVPAPLATDGAGQFIAGPADDPGQISGAVATPNASNPSTNNIANWANRNSNNAGIDMFSDNCANFVSLALNRGRGMPSKINWGS